MAPFVVAVIFAAWLGGLRPALLATLLSICAVLLAPYPAGAFTASASRLAVFGMICLAIGIVAESLLRSQRQAMEHASALQEEWPASGMADR